GRGGSRVGAGPARRALPAANGAGTRGNREGGGGGGSWIGIEIAFQFQTSREPGGKSTPKGPAQSGRHGVRTRGRHRRMPRGDRAPRSAPARGSRDTRPPRRPRR